MSPGLAHLLADLVLVLHAGVVLFNIFWMIAVPVGAWRGWRFVRNLDWRVAHLVSLAVVAIQPLMGRYCFLTLAQDALEAQAASGGAAPAPNLIERVATAIVFWPLPPWIFVYLYVAAFVWSVALWWIVPPRRTARASSR